MLSRKGGVVDDKTKELVEAARDYENKEVTGQAVGLACEMVGELRMAVLEQDKRARHAEAERDAFDKRITELEAQLAEATALRTARKQREYDVACAYFDALEKADGSDLTVLEQELDELLAPEHGNQAFVAFCEQKRLVKFARVESGRARIAELEAELEKQLRREGSLHVMLANCGLPSEPKALAGVVEREREANRARIAELEKENAHLRTFALGA